MGYNIDQTDQNFTLRADKQAGALAAAKALFAPEVMQAQARGGSWSGGKQTEHWYSWVTTREALAAETMEAMFACWGFPLVDTDPSGDITAIYWESGKTGQEEVFLAAIAPFVESGSFIAFEGEDGAHWRYVFDGEAMLTQSGRIAFDDDDSDGYIPAIPPILAAARAVVAEALRAHETTVETYTTDRRTRMAASALSTTTLEKFDEIVAPLLAAGV